MPNTAFQKEWNEIATRWGLSVETPFVVEVAGEDVTVPVLLGDFGGAHGILLVLDFGLISSYADDLVALGYGFSCLGEPTGIAHPGLGSDADEALVEMLVDWGCSGDGSAPAWYRDSAI